MQYRFNNELRHLPKNFIVAVVSRGEVTEQVSMELLDYLVNKRGQVGSYIAVNRPYSNMVQLLRDRQIDIRRLFFIDMITKGSGMKCEGPNCVFLESPSDLTELGIQLDAVFKQGLNEFVMLDSINALSIYNSHERLVRFVHFFANSVRMHDLKGVMIALPEDSDKDLLITVSQFCDKVIYM